MRDILTVKRDEIKSIIEKYMEGGEGAPVTKHLKAARNERLAHRQLDESPAEPTGTEASEQEIEALYQDTLRAVSTLLSLVSGRYSHIETEATKVYGHHARYFWASVRGERTEGHPSFRPRIKE